MIRAIVILAATVQAAYANPPQIAKRFAITQIPLPAKHAQPTTSFAVCGGAVVMVPVDGALIAPELGITLIPARSKPVTTVSCDAAGDAYWLAGRTLLRTTGAARKVESLADLPAGDLHIVDRVEQQVRLWGKTSERWAVMSWDVAGGVTTLFSGDKPITAAASAGQDALVFATGREVWVWRARRAQRLVTMSHEVDGLAVGSDGSVFVSTENGVAALTSMRDKPVTLVTGIHGPLIARLGALYVLSSDNNVILRLVDQGIQ